nr:MAG TPA: hypothetical protein [Caudoviricetes sp.]
MPAHRAVEECSAYGFTPCVHALRAGLFSITAVNIVLLFMGYTPFLRGFSPSAALFSFVIVLYHGYSIMTTRLFDILSFLFDLI